MLMQNHIEYGLFRVLTTGLHLVPHRLAARGMQGLATVAARHRWWRAEVAYRQMAEVFPGYHRDQIEDLLEKLYGNLATTILEVFGEDPSAVASRVRVPSGWGPLERALALNKGLILASLHLGNFELCGRVVAGKCRLLDVVKPQRNPLFDRYLDRMRRSHGIATVLVEGAARVVLAHLKQGGVVSLLLDQDAGNKGVPVDFLGQTASTWPGAARLSLQTGCPVLPLCLARNDQGNHELEFGTLLDPNGLTPAERDPTAYTQLITAELETFIRRHPEQWFWVHRRWKHEPGGNA